MVVCSEPPPLGCTNHPIPCLTFPTCTPCASCTPPSQKRDAFTNMHHMAELYHAYYIVHRASVLPYRDVPPTTLFNAAVFLYKHLVQLESSDLPPGVSIARTARCLAQVAGNIKAYKTARLVYDKLHTLYVPHDQRVCWCVLLRCSWGGVVKVYTPVPQYTPNNSLLAPQRHV